MLRIISTLIFMLSVRLVCGQSLSFLSDDNFAFKVKQIDEFMERFNSVESTPIRRYVRERYTLDSISQASLVLSLFNQEDTTWNRGDIRNLRVGYYSGLCFVERLTFTIRGGTLSLTVPVGTREKTKTSR